MGRRSWRWAVLALGVSLLVLLPTLASALPVRTTTLSAQELLRRVRASGAVGWSGYGESRGALVLPDVRELSDLPSLVGGTTRARAWWRGTRDWRVDALSLVGETDTTRDPDGGWTWQSADRRAVRVVGELDVRLPTAADLLAPALGRRLAGTPDVDASRLPGRRVAGRSTDGLRLVPRDPASTTVRSVDLWADPVNGLPLRVEVNAEGADEPQLVALLLDLDLHRPPAERTRFSRPVGAAVTVGEAPDIAALADRFAPYLLPDELAGLPRRSRSALSTGGGVGTYGDGFTVLALVPVPGNLARRVIERVDPQDDDRTGAVSTPLVNALIGEGRRGRAYVLVGTVPQARLVLALAQLRAAPPPRVRR